MLGTIILWFGWYGFDAGSALITTSKEQDQLLSLCALNTTLSGGMAGLVSLFLNYFILERRTGEPIFDVVLAMNGTLGGLVAITAGCGVGKSKNCQINDMTVFRSADTLPLLFLVLVPFKLSRGLPWSLVPVQEYCTSGPAIF